MNKYFLSFWALKTFIIPLHLSMFVVCQLRKTTKQRNISQVPQNKQGCRDLHESRANKNVHLAQIKINDKEAKFNFLHHLIDHS